MTCQMASCAVCPGFAKGRAVLSTWWLGIKDDEYRSLSITVWRHMSRGMKLHSRRWRPPFASLGFSSIGSERILTLEYGSYGKQLPAQPVQSILVLLAGTSKTKVSKLITAILSGTCCQGTCSQKVCDERASPAQPVRCRFFFNACLEMMFFPQSCSKPLVGYIAESSGEPHEPYSNP